MLRENNVNFRPHRVSNFVALDGKIQQSHGMTNMVSLLTFLGPKQIIYKFHGLQ